MEASHTIATRADSLFTIARLLLPPILGAACAFVLLDRVVLGHVHLGEAQRIVSLGQHLEQTAPPNWLPVLGDSIVRDGIDSALAEGAASSAWRVENLGVSGCSLTERQILLPKLLARQPAAVVIGVYPTDLCVAGGLGIDEAHAYARAGFMDDWPAGDLPGNGADMTPERVRALRATGWRLTLAYRTVLSDWLEYRARFALRSDLRRDYVDDWRQPFTRLTSVRGARLRAHLATVRADWLSCRADPSPIGRRAVISLMNDIRSSGAIPIALLLPVHPALLSDDESVLAAQRTSLVQQAQSQNALLLDASDVLDETHFADAVHPNAAGRAILSRWLGRRLPSPPGQ